MAYSHGRKWSDTDIEKEIKNVVEVAKINTFPTHSLIKEVTGSCALTTAISRRGGSEYWAERIGLEVSPCESKFGFEYERICAEILTANGYECKHTPPRYPYDILVNGNIKIDVKSSNLYKGKTGDYYTFRLEKAMPTCDIFVCFCINENGATTVYVIPSCVVSGLVQLSIGKTDSKYNKYIANWELVKRYDEFYKVTKGALLNGKTTKH